MYFKLLIWKLIGKCLHFDKLRYILQYILNQKPIKDSLQSMAKIWKLWKPVIFYKPQNIQHHFNVIIVNNVSCVVWDGSHVFFLNFNKILTIFLPGFDRLVASFWSAKLIDALLVFLWRWWHHSKRVFF